MLVYTIDNYRNIGKPEWVDLMHVLRQEGFPSLKSGEWWADMEEVFDCG